MRQIDFSESSLVLLVDFKPFHNFDFAPVKNFIKKKSHRLLLREAVQRAGQPAPSGATYL
jgi:hypothetical protein